MSRTEASRLACLCAHLDRPHMLQVASIAEDAKRGLLGGSDDARQGGEGLRLLLRDKGVAHVPFEGWKRINAVEVERGAERGKPREKMVDVYQMVEVARSTS